MNIDNVLLGAWRLTNLLNEVEKRTATRKGHGAAVYLADGKVTLDRVIVPVAWLREIRAALEE